METLKPQFVPGQSIALNQSGNIEEKLTHLQLAQENDNMKSQVSENIYIEICLLITEKLALKLPICSILKLKPSQKF